MEILKDGFRQLEEDRKALEAEKRKFLIEKNELRETETACGETANVAEVLFRNALNPLALRKRYKDLIKIFHPDNLFGDADLAQQINKEFTKRRKQE